MTVLDKEYFKKLIISKNKEGSNLSRLAQSNYSSFDFYSFTIIILCLLIFMLVVVFVSYIIVVLKSRKNNDSGNNIELIPNGGYL